MARCETNADAQFTAKSLQRQAKKANKDETTEKNKVKMVSELTITKKLEPRERGTEQGMNTERPED